MSAYICKIIMRFLRYLVLVLGNFRLYLHKPLPSPSRKVCKAYCDGNCLSRPLMGAIWQFRKSPATKWVVI